MVHGFLEIDHAKLLDHGFTSSMMVSYFSAL